MAASSAPSASSVTPVPTAAAVGAVAPPAAAAVAMPPVSIPDALAIRVGFAGLAPFVLGALLVWLVRADALRHAALALSVYAGMMVCFLGAIHWGLMMLNRLAEPRQLTWAVAASALAWVSVVMPPHAGLVIQGVALIGCYLVDRRIYPLFGLSKWMTLRFRLTVFAVLSCFVAAARF